MLIKLFILISGLSKVLSQCCDNVSPEDQYCVCSHVDPNSVSFYADWSNNNRGGVNSGSLGYALEAAMNFKDGPNIVFGSYFWYTINSVGTQDEERDFVFSAVDQLIGRFCSNPPATCGTMGPGHISCHNSCQFPSKIEITVYRISSAGWLAGLSATVGVNHVGSGGIGKVLCNDITSLVGYYQTEYLWGKNAVSFFLSNVCQNL